MISLSTARFICAFFLAVALFGWQAAFGAEPFSQFTVEIADLPKSKELASVFTAKGFKTVIPPKNLRVTDPQNNGSVWIGKNVPLEMLRVVLPEAIRWNPYLMFFHVVGDRGETPPARIDNTIHIGGHIDGAMIWKLNVIDHADFLNALAKAKTVQEVHAYLHEKNIPREESPAGKPAPAK